MKCYNKRLIIEALSLKMNSAYSLREFIYNILDYIKINRKEIVFSDIVLICDKRILPYLEKYTPEISLYAFNIKNIFHKYYILNTFENKLGLGEGDTVLFPNNYSSMTKCCRHILVVHDLLYIRRKYVSSLFFRIQRTLFVPRSIKIADNIIAISEWVKSDIISKIGSDYADKIIPIRNYFNFLKFENGELDQVIEKFVKSNSYFIVVSSPTKHKNVVSVLKAYVKYLKKSSNKNKLVIVGKLEGEPYLSYIKMDSDIRDNICLFDNISNRSLGHLYCHAVAYISATLFEGLGMPIIEAMYYNVPAIVSDIEVVRECTGGLAIYFDPMNVQLLSNLMLEYENRKEVTNYRPFIIDLYSEQNTVEKYFSVLEN